MNPFDSIDLLRGRRILVAGFSLRSGVGAVRLLRSLDCRVAAWDEKTGEALSEQKRQLQGEAYDLFAGPEALEPGRVLEGMEGIVLSPGLPRVHPLLTEADRRGIPVVGEVELAWLYHPGRWVCITGTDGKTTTTTLTGRIFEAAGLRTLTAGNIGVGLCGALVRPDGVRPDVVVAELSSFQLETIRTLRPSTAVVLNITPDHLDRYGSMEEYAAAKARIWMNQTPRDTLIVNADDEWIGRMLAKFPPVSRVVLFSRSRRLADGLSVSLGRFVHRSGGKRTIVGRTGRTVLKGEHNKENMLAAAGCGMSEGVPAGTLQKTIESFRGLEHRNEECGRLKQRVFVNDSKATTVNAVRMALLSAKGRVILLMGGRSKGDDFSRLDGLVRKKVRTLVCFGEAAKEIRSAMPSARAVEETRTLAEALGAAWKKSRKGDTILLSPGCTSFDAFKNFEERGRVFKDLVKDLTVSVTSGVRK